MLFPAPNSALPPDHDEFIQADPPSGRVIVIAPTRAACETIEIAFSLYLETFLERTAGQKVRELARSGTGFGIVAGTGTGKTLAVRPIAEEILRAPLRVGVVNREREATPELPLFNAIVVTTGVARRWFQDGDILARDTLIIDEIHQTSAELELCLALGKRVGCRFIWLSATVDPKFYRRYLDSHEVLEVFSFDPEKAADVRVVDKAPLQFLDDRFLRDVKQNERGVGVFLPTRAGVEEAAGEVAERFPDLNAVFYHGGEPIRAIRPFLEEDAPRPFVLAMTAAGQSALNVRGLDTVVIDDTRFSNRIERGRNVLTRTTLGNNEILQMAGRVHGRVAGGRVFILSQRAIDFYKLKPTAPEFQLAGDSERVALTCADLGVRADELELPVPLDKTAYRIALSNLQKRGIIQENGRLSTYGKAVEALPVDRPWAELIVNGDTELLPFLAVMSSIESLHRMTRDERDLSGLIVFGSDHLTAYNLYAEAFKNAGFIGEVYGLPRQLFEAEKIAQWAEKRGVLVKSLEDAALAMACVFRGMKQALPDEMPLVTEKIKAQFTELLARWMPFDLAIDETTADGQFARVGRTSVCGERGPIAGELRYFADRYGVARAAIEGTQIPFSQIRRYAKKSPAEIVYNVRQKPASLVLHWQTEYFGFVLESGSEILNTFAGELAQPARRALAQALARFEARHAATHRNRANIDEIRELYRRSAGQTPRLGEAELAAHYEKLLELQGVQSLEAFRRANLPIEVEEFVAPEERAKWWALPSKIRIGTREVAIGYEIEDGDPPVEIARLQMSQKLVATLEESELPELDRPVRFAVSRGPKGVVRADSLEQLSALLATPEESAATKKSDVKRVQRKPRGLKKLGARKKR